MSNTIVVTGITDLECYPTEGFTRYYKQGMSSNSIFLPELKPDIESINEIKVDIDIKAFKIIRTVLGTKVLVYGFLYAKIIYTADNSQQSLHSAHWDIPFSDFILLKELSYERCKNTLKYVFGGIEDVNVNYGDKRIVDISIAYILCPQFKKCNEVCTNKHNIEDKKVNTTCKKVYVSKSKRR